MPILQKLVNFDEMFHQLPETPIIINDLHDDSEEDKEYVKNLLTTKYGDDMISLIPSCRCGKLRGEFSSTEKCEECNTIVKSQVENAITPIVWFRKPDGVQKLINPIIWILLRTRFTKSGFCIIQWLVDTTYRSNAKQPEILERLASVGITRGYNNFVTNFSTIMEFLFTLPGFKVKRKQRDFLQELLLLHADCIFSDYIPVPNKALLIIENTNVGVYVDPIIVEAIDAIQMLVSIDRDFYDQNKRVKENRTIKAITRLCNYYEDFFKKKLAPKPGQFRKHVYGTRTNNSSRAVISSITEPHEYDEIHVPWGIGLAMFRPHLLNKLMKLGMDRNSAIGHILGHVNRHNDMLEKLLRSLITESGNRLMSIIQRNPSLMQGSALRMRITKFKHGPKSRNDQGDQTISIPIIVVASLNADFDGDQINLSLAVDEKMGDHWESLDPKFNIFQLDRPNKTSRNISMPKPVIASMSVWIEQ